jgi:hypothetical protein
VGLLFAAIGLALGAAAGYAALRVLARAEPRDPAAQAELDRAVASVDRELAANLELTTMYDQTRQAFVLENGQFEAHRSVLEREVPAAYRQVAALYERIPEAEMAMERRGPAGSIPGPDRETVQAWEGDAREAQRTLRSAAVERPASPLRRLLARLRV